MNTNLWLQSFESNAFEQRLHPSLFLLRITTFFASSISSTALKEAQTAFNFRHSLNGLNYFYEELLPIAVESAAIQHSPAAGQLLLLSTSDDKYLPLLHFMSEVFSRDQLPTALVRRFDSHELNFYRLLPHLSALDLTISAVASPTSDLKHVSGILNSGSTILDEVHHLATDLAWQQALFNHSAATDALAGSLLGLVPFTQLSEFHILDILDRIHFFAADTAGRSETVCSDNVVLNERLRIPVISADGYADLRGPTVQTLRSCFSELPLSNASFLLSHASEVSDRLILLGKLRQQYHATVAQALVEVRSSPSRESDTPTREASCTLLQLSSRLPEMFPTVSQAESLTLSASCSALAVQMSAMLERSSIFSADSRDVVVTVWQALGTRLAAHNSMVDLGQHIRRFILSLPIMRRLSVVLQPSQYPSSLQQKTVQALEIVQTGLDLASDSKNVTTLNDLAAKLKCSATADTVELSVACLIGDEYDYLGNFTRSIEQILDAPVGLLLGEVVSIKQAFIGFTEWQQGDLRTNQSWSSLPLSTVSPSKQM